MNKIVQACIGTFDTIVGGDCRSLSKVYKNICNNGLTGLDIALQEEIKDVSSIIYETNIEQMEVYLIYNHILLHLLSDKPGAIFLRQQMIDGLISAFGEGQ